MWIWFTVALSYMLSGEGAQRKIACILSSSSKKPHSLVDVIKSTICYNSSFSSTLWKNSIQITRLGHDFFITRLVRIKRMFRLWRPIYRTSVQQHIQTMYHVSKLYRTIIKFHTKRQITHRFTDSQKNLCSVLFYSSLFRKIETLKRKVKSVLHCLNWIFMT